MSKQRKAVSLISGGLDSMLATRAIQDQGIHVEGINFYTGFCVEGHTHAIRRKDTDKEKRNNALWQHYNRLAYLTTTNFKDYDRYNHRCSNNNGFGL